MVFGGPGRSGLEQQVTLVPVRLVKGLEVDAAVVVEPARIVVEECQGVRSLYVALTRAYPAGDGRPRRAPARGPGRALRSRLSLRSEDCWG